MLQFKSIFSWIGKDIEDVIKPYRVSDCYILTLTEFTELAHKFDVLVTTDHNHLYMWLDDKGKMFRQRG